jgi:hypothetical protein
MSPAIDPIAPWPAVAIAAAVVIALTLLAYRKKLHGTSGRWRWVALGLRLAAVALCLLAALRPSMLVLSKVKQSSLIVFLTDTSGSMSLGGEAGGQTRLAAAQRTLTGALGAVKDLGADVVPKVLTFDAELHEPKPEEPPEANGRVTATGTALDEAAKRFAAARILRIVLLSDGASNSGPDPTFVAETLRDQRIAVVTVGFGSETTGNENRDIAVRDIEAGPIVYAKTQLEVFAKLDVRGYANETLKVNLRVEGKPDPVARAEVKVPPGVTELNLRGLKWTPDTPGETKVTLAVEPMKGELLTTNNESSTFVTVLKGGISVLYLSGPSSPWEKRFVGRVLDASDKIQLTLQVLFEPAGADLDAAFQRGKYDVFILGDLPAAFLSRVQQRALAQAVRDGAGLIMLGGRSSFGSGGWTGTDVADVLPVDIHPGDGQLEPEGGIKVLPNTMGLDSFVLRLAPTAAENRAVWESLPPIGGTNRFDAKLAGRVWALTPQNQPVVVALETGKGRTLAFGGETWPWARNLFDDRARMAHLNFWRNAILWLSHKEDEGETQVRLELDHRRVALGQNLDMAATARDAKGQPITDAEFKTIVSRSAPDARPETITLFRQGDAWKGKFLATADPGEYKVEVTATRGGTTIGSATARFLVFDDDREMRRTAADLASLRAIAKASEGAYLPPEQLEKYIRDLKTEIVPDYTTQREVRLWDSWPFLLIFAALLTLEWFIRKRHGWV